MINKIQENSYMTQVPMYNKKNCTSDREQSLQNYAHEVSFKNKTGGSVAGKKFWLIFSRLSEKMKDPSEILNAIIQAIGTGIIAPLIILVSPGKGDKDDKDKKFFQAIRQPISACLAFGFTTPVTMMNSRILDWMAYKKNVKFFDHEGFGSLVPDEKYLRRHIKKEDVDKLAQDFETVGEDGKSLKQELENQIKEEYGNVGLEVSDEDLAKRVKKKKEEFLEKKLASRQHKDLVNKKMEELKKLSPKELPLEDLKIVPEDYQRQAKEMYKKEFDQIKADAKLNIFDKILDSMGFSNKKLTAVKDAEDEFKQRRGYEILKNENPGKINDRNFRLQKYVEAMEAESKKLFKHRKFLITLFFNLFMTALSCFALNWAHPRLKVLIDKRRAKKQAMQNQNNEQQLKTQKVEVKA